ncbi:hypothetical protein BGW36DRAFT_427217 [Talaromyces proteolyticus]|uniref:JmjC domain-containing protein n=1 Tax=Talaromyces proteolyticus TaxID=1131652 RepID=A0AAD4KQR2_9EURO|nr:uncharacterized protein BGW36DRAFT_427217 [Talaromyces proteolyticus]KAH8697250.1 hypothetical protein BGW36DRAFT_427217 [Talaromyces proteolyticus]
MGMTLKWHGRGISTYKKHIFSRHLSTHQPNPTTHHYTPLNILTNPTIQDFRNKYFHPEKPTILHSSSLRNLPARRNWFVKSTPSTPACFTLNHAYFENCTDTLVPLELTTSTHDQFQRFDAPLAVFLDWIRSSLSPSSSQPFSLYLAQCQVSNLPAPLPQDLPTPDIVLHAGRGDVYDTNIWIGLPPTYTPLHRDPNPNLFLQLAGTKHVRLLAPEEGLKVFSRVRGALGRDAGRGAVVFRGEEMMKGREKEMLEDAVWGGRVVSGGGDKEGGWDGVGYEAVLKGGEALFIPKGWWHSIKGVGEGVTASVNWWFR